MAASKDKPGFMKEIIKKYGNVISTGNQILDQRKDFKAISVGPSIAISLGGGI